MERQRDLPAFLVERKTASEVDYKRTQAEPNISRNKLPRQHLKERDRLAEELALQRELAREEKREERPDEPYGEPFNCPANAKNGPFHFSCSVNRNKWYKSFTQCI